MLRFYYIGVKQLKEKSHMQYGNMHFPIGNPKKISDILKLISIQEEQCPSFHNTSATITMTCSPRNGNNSPRRLSILSKDQQKFPGGGYHFPHGKVIVPWVICLIPHNAQLSFFSTKCSPNEYTTTPQGRII